MSMSHIVAYVEKDKIWPRVNFMTIFGELYSNKKDTSDFHGTVSFDPIKMSQQKIYQNSYQKSDTQKMVII